MNGIAFPDTVVGTDSHTTMINGLGVVGWGVGGIEAEAVMLGQPMDMLLPDVIGFKLYGKLKEGVTATDLVLTVTQILRKKGVVDKFVEFFGPGLDSMSLPDRALVANMSPEYGATMGYFPVDAETLRYMRLSGRPEESRSHCTEAYCRAQGLFRDAGHSRPGIYRNARTGSRVGGALPGRTETSAGPCCAECNEIRVPEGSHCAGQRTRL